MVTELPFSYGKPHIAPSEFYKMAPTVYPKSRHMYTKKPKPVEVEPKIVRNVKHLPKHLIGRVHTVPTENKVYAMWSFYTFNKVNKQNKK